MRFLQQRDLDFDFCRTMLVIGMVLAHVFIWFSTLKASWFFASIIIGFVFLSGLAIGVLYTDRMAVDRLKESREAELDSRGVEAEELVFESEFMSGRDSLAALVERAEEFGEEIGGSPVVGVGKRGAGHWPRAKVVKPASIGVEITDAVTHGRPGCEVNKG